ncbi:uncharacterized protein EHS24_009121 [Apiotrichum porosum]|uniref:Homologous-pairing protein 2 winged helix domain-containing protein n=1 Tax=Apiotrichum porosum TaxID=105984 RepID=A0A427XNY1_9TREE|nr:uncharacterized protein EHS24_009121 [Apiotrichum porosum]RSH80540.1 hypothetical protein EHS24_009121 [Apiotrichum porosum]
MPPKADKKDKVVTVKGNEAEEKILDYMRGVSHPARSAADLRRTALTRACYLACAQPTEKGSLTVKTYGKQTIFVFSQSQLTALNPEDMATLDADTKKAKGVADKRRKELRDLQAKIGEQEALPVTTDLVKTIESVTAENDLTIKTLGPLRGETAVAPMTADEMMAIDVEWDKWKKMWVDRKKVYKNLIDILAESPAYSNKEDLEDTVGVDDDDDETVEIERGEFFRPPTNTVRVGLAKRPLPSAMSASAPGVAQSLSSAKASSTPTSTTKTKRPRV